MHCLTSNDQCYTYTVMFPLYTAYFDVSEYMQQFYINGYVWDISAVQLLKAYIIAIAHVYLMEASKD